MSEVGKPSIRKERSLSGIVPPQSSQFGQLGPLFFGHQRFARITNKNSDDNNDGCNDKYDGDGGNLDDNNDKK